jgi:hypothetical protein
VIADTGAIFFVHLLSYRKTKFKIMLMRKTLLFTGLFISLMFWVNFSFAQCTPDPLITDPEGDGAMSPDTLYGTVGVNMNTILSIICPTTASVPGIPLPITIHHISIHSISYKPAYLGYTCPNNCDFAAGVPQCALVTGTPTAVDTVYMKVLVDVFTGATTCASCLLFPNGYDRGDTLVLIVKQAGSVEEFGNNGFNIIQNQPNPFSSETSIGCYTAKPGSVSLKVVDMLGSLVYTERMNTRTGENYFNFTGLNLSNGVYFYSVMNSQKQVITRKMVKVN